MHTGGADTACQLFVGADHEYQPAAPGDPGDPLGKIGALGRAVVAEDNAAAARQTFQRAPEFALHPLVRKEPAFGQVPSPARLAAFHAQTIAAGVNETEDRLVRVRAAMDKAARLAKREAADVELIAVSKTHAAERIEPLLAAGHRSFGENRVQEAAAKWPALRQRYPDAVLHMVGQLQSNKAEAAAALFDVIHSVDRSSLVKALAKAADRSGRRPRCFLQVDLAEEAQKGGVAPPRLGELLAAARAADLNIEGLMTLPPADREPAPYFALLAELARRHGVAGLSMGMSGDFETAIMLGATHVRVGTALFGERG